MVVNDLRYVPLLQRLRERREAAAARAAAAAEWARTAFQVRAEDLEFWVFDLLWDFFYPG